MSAQEIHLRGQHLAGLGHEAQHDGEVMDGAIHLNDLARGARRVSLGLPVAGLEQEELGGADGDEHGRQSGGVAVER